VTPSSCPPRFYWITFDDHVARLPAHTDLLDPGERARADSYTFAEDRRRFVITRAFLRLTLADTLRTAPSALTFDYAPQRKPFLMWPREGRALHFNVSHSGDHAVIATAWHRPIGVDVERVRGDIDYAQIAERVFSPRERAALAGVDPAARADTFFQVWTRKEAYVKAQGLGLSIPLDSFDVAHDGIAQTEISPESLLATRPDPDEAARWSVRALAAPRGYAAALAYCMRASVPAPTSYALPRP
jgi:4'-phosphopantetheinyl transferase